MISDHTTSLSYQINSPSSIKRVPMPCLHIPSKKAQLSPLSTDANLKYIQKYHFQNSHLSTNKSLKIDQYLQPQISYYPTFSSNAPTSPQQQLFSSSSLIFTNIDQSFKAKQSQEQYTNNTFLNQTLSPSSQWDNSGRCDEKFSDNTIMCRSLIGQNQWHSFKNNSRQFKNKETQSLQPLGILLMAQNNNEQKFADIQSEEINSKPKDIMQSTIKGKVLQFTNTQIHLNQSEMHLKRKDFKEFKNNKKDYLFEYWEGKNQISKEAQSTEKPSFPVTKLAQKATYKNQYPLFPQDNSLLQQQIDYDKLTQESKSSSMTVLDECSSNGLVIQALNCSRKNQIDQQNLSKYLPTSKSQIFLRQGKMASKLKQEDSKQKRIYFLRNKLELSNQRDELEDQQQQQDEELDKKHKQVTVISDFDDINGQVDGGGENKIKQESVPLFLLPKDFDKIKQDDQNDCDNTSGLQQQQLNFFEQQITGEQQQSEDEEQEQDPKIESKEQQQSAPVQITLLKSVYEGRPPTVFFQYPECCLIQRNNGGRIIFPSKQQANKWNLSYKMNNVSKPFQSVVKSLEAGGLSPVTPNNLWSVYWAGDRLATLKDLAPQQKINHFWGCWNLGRKDTLYLKMLRQKRRFPKEYDFIPRTLLLNQDYDRFQQELVDNPEKLWILKPVASCCGRGIKVISKQCNIQKEKRKLFLASEYITSPHLINGLKYDLRLYVLVSSYDPLRVYFHSEGLVRFATEQYDTKGNNHQNKQFMHLTNYSINKFSPNFQGNYDETQSSSGSKWSLSSWKSLMVKLIGEQQSSKLMLNIEDLIIKVCIGVEPFMMESLDKKSQHRTNCFELYGFDVIIDSNFKPWLLEVNICPSLSSSSPLDRQIKTTLISDILNLIGIQPLEKQAKKVLSQQTEITKYINSSQKVQTESASKKKLPAQFGATQNYFTKPTPVIRQSVSRTSSPEDKRPMFSKNIKEMNDLDSQNCIFKLSQEDWQMLFESDEENYRTGNFKRIFPPLDSKDIEKYNRLFEYPRYNNFILWKLLKSPSNFLSVITNQIYNQNC